MMKHLPLYKNFKNRKETFRHFSIGLLGILILLWGIIPLPSLLGLGGGTARSQGQIQATTLLSPPGPPKLSILLLMDVSGSMGNNNKLDQAKAAAISAINSALKPLDPQTSQPQVQVPEAKPAIASALANSPIPGIPPLIARKFLQNLDALAEIQKLLGPDIRTWVTKTPAQEMGKLLKNCQALMEGLAFDKKSILMQRLNPLMEKMHYSIAARVNQELLAKGATKGLLYVIPGKTPANPEFGGLFTLKPSDHDAIYLGEGADDAVRLHKDLAKVYGDDFLTLTESCLESSKYTFEKLSRGMRPEAFQNFSGPMSNLDWMRSRSGSAWVGRYVDKAGTVVPLSEMTDVSKIKPAGEPGSGLRSLSSYTDQELADLGVVLDRSARPPAYNLGLQSDFERQLALNRARKGLEKGLAVSSADDTAMLMGKYGPRYQEVLDGAGVNLEQTAWKGYVDDLKAVGAKAAHGDVLSAADQAVIDKFDEFAGYVRSQSMAQQMRRFATIKQNLIDAAGDSAAVARLRTQMTDLIDDTQAALHNYQQLYGKDFADDLVRTISQTHDDMAKGLARRLRNSPWVVNEQSIGFCVEKELAAQGKLPSPGSTIPKSAVISDSQSLWQYARQNPGHVLAKAAQYGAYIWMGYEVLSKFREGKDSEALQTAGMFAGTEAGVRIANYALAAKYGPWVGPGVVLAAAGGFMVGNMAAQWAINSQVNEMSLEIMSGYSNDGSRTFGTPDQMLQGGMLEYMTKARPTRVVNPDTGETTNWVEFDSPHEAASLTDDQIMSQFKPGTFGNSEVSVDPNGTVTIVTDHGTKLEVVGPGEIIQVPDIRTQVIPKSQIVAHTRLQQMYQSSRGKYNDALANGTIQPGSQNIPSDFTYVDPDATFPGSQFTVPNDGKMTMHEFSFYRMMFERTWSRWSLDKNAQFSQSSMYWGANMENAYKAKWSMFKAFIASMNEGKIRDREFQEKLAKDTPENLAALKMLAEQGIPFFVDGKKLTADDIQKMIDKKLEERRNLLDKIKDGVIQIDLPEDLEKILGGLSAMALGDIEIGIMPYSGSCSSTFSLFGFSRNPEVLKAAINSLSAGGSTPMTPALYQARYALLKYGKGQAGTIILLCDGQNSCSENPVEAADNIRKSVFSANPGGMATRLLQGLQEFKLFPVLYAQDQTKPQFRKIDLNDPIPPERRNVPVTVSTVGFFVSQKEQQILDDVAAAGGGISGSAQNMEQLTQAFSSAIQSASQSFGASGGGGGIVVGYRRTNWPLIIGVSLLLMSGLLITAILVMRNRGPTASGLRALAHLDVTYQDGGTKTFTITKRTSIGRSSASDLVLHDDEASGQHAEIVISTEGFLLRDLGSSNGTFVNDRQIGELFLAIGDRIRMGSTDLVFRD